MGFTSDDTETFHDSSLLQTVDVLHNMLLNSDRILTSGTETFTYNFLSF